MKSSQMNCIKLMNKITWIVLNQWMNRVQWMNLIESNQQFETECILMEKNHLFLELVDVMFQFARFHQTLLSVTHIQRCQFHLFHKPIPTLTSFQLLIEQLCNYFYDWYTHTVISIIKLSGRRRRHTLLFSLWCTWKWTFPNNQKNTSKVIVDSSPESLLTLVILHLPRRNSFAIACCLSVSLFICLSVHRSSISVRKSTGSSIGCR